MGSSSASRASASPIAYRTGIDGKCGGDLQFGRLASFPVRALGSASASGPQNRSEVIVEPGILQPAVPGPFVQQLPGRVHRVRKWR